MVLGERRRRALDAVAGEASGRLFEAVAEGGELVVYGLLGSDRVAEAMAHHEHPDRRVKILLV